MEDTMFAQRRKLLLSLLLAGLVVPLAGATRWYVNANQRTATPDGLSWCTAFHELSEALSPNNSQLLAGDEIWVAMPTPYQPSYKPAVSYPDPNDSDERRETFFVKPGVRVYGGFLGADPAHCADPNNPVYFPGEALRSDRDPERNITILDGDIGLAGIETDNSYHVVYFEGIDTEGHETKLSGFTIRNGYADGATIHDRNGGGILVFLPDDAQNPNAGPLLDRLVIEDNFAQGNEEYPEYYGGGGACVFSDGQAYFSNCVFRNNRVQLGFGGGILMVKEEYPSITLQNCIFIGNTVVYGNGGGGMVEGDQLRNLTFFGNHVESPYDPAVGGAFFWPYSPNDPLVQAVIRNSIVWGNDEPQLGGTAAIYSDIGDASEWIGNPPQSHDNIHEDPLLRDPDRGVVRVRVCRNNDGDVITPTIDAGADDDVLNDTTDVDDTPTTLDPFPWDLDKRHRFIALTPAPSTPGYVDMGAYEECAAGDLNGNGSVELADLTQMLSCFGQAPCDVPVSSCCIADIAGASGCADGEVGLADLTVLLSEFGTVCAAAGSPPSEAITTGDDPLTLWLRSATAEQVLEWWQAGMPPIGEW